MLIKLIMLKMFFTVICSLLIIGSNGYQFDYNQLNNNVMVESSGIVTAIPDRSRNQLTTIKDVMVEVAESFNETAPTNIDNYIVIPLTIVNTTFNNYVSVSVDNLKTSVKNDYGNYFATDSLIDAIVIGSEGEGMGSYLNVSAVSNYISLDILICAANKLNSTLYNAGCIRSNSKSLRKQLSTSVYHGCCDCDVGCCGCWICWGRDSCTTDSPRGPTLEETELMKNYLKSLMFPDIFKYANQFTI